MSAPRLLFDEDFNGRIIRGLRRRMSLPNATTVHGEGLDSRHDDDVLEWAAAHNWVVVTHDVETMPGHAYRRVKQGLSMPGVVVVPQSLGIGPAIEELTFLIGASEADEFANRVIFLPQLGILLQQ